MRGKNDGSKISRITLEMPVDSALEMFIETGDLPVTKHPTLKELAEIITEVLNVGDETRSFVPLGAMLCSVEKPK